MSFRVIDSTSAAQRKASYAYQADTTMRSTGFKVYRYKGLYFVYYNNDNSCPSYFGLKVRDEVPSGGPRFEKWVASLGRELDEEFELLKGGSRELFVIDKQPTGNVQWLYEIDLDNRVFHVDRQPLFRLDNLPPRDMFVKAISFDHFGHRAYDKSLPEEYRYDWHPSPPAPEPRFLDVYASHCDESSKVSIHEVLGIPHDLSAPERARTRLMEAVVIRVLEEQSVGHDLRVLESVPNRDQMSGEVRSLACLLVRLAVGLPIPPTHSPNENPRDFKWFGNNLCLYLTTHLEDTRTLQASVGALIHHIKDTPQKPGVIYGVACSMFHCVVVCVDKNGGSTYKHTPALQFLPSFYSTTSATPGIEALSRLGCRTILESHTYLHGLWNTRGIADRRRLPIELWLEICSYIVSPSDLIHLGVALPEAMPVTTDLLQYPYIWRYRLMDAIGPAPSPLGGEETNESRPIYDRMHSPLATFKAFDGCRTFNLHLGRELGDPDHNTQTWRQYHEWSSLASESLTGGVFYDWMKCCVWEHRVRR